MLLKNVIVEHKLMSGSVGIIGSKMKIVTKIHMRLITVVEFPNSTLPTPLIPGKSVIWVPIPQVTNLCEKNAALFLHSHCKCAMHYQSTKAKE